MSQLATQPSQLSVSFITLLFHATYDLSAGFLLPATKRVPSHYLLFLYVELGGGWACYLFSRCLTIRVNCGHISINANVVLLVFHLSMLIDPGGEGGYVITPGPEPTKLSFNELHRPAVAIIPLYVHICL